MSNEKSSLKHLYQNIFNGPFASSPTINMELSTSNFFGAISSVCLIATLIFLGVYFVDLALGHIFELLKVKNEHSTSILKYVGVKFFAVNCLLCLAYYMIGPNYLGIPIIYGSLYFIFLSMGATWYFLVENDMFSIEFTKYALFLVMTLLFFNIFVLVNSNCPSLTFCYLGCGLMLFLDAIL